MTFEEAEKELSAWEKELPEGARGYTLLYDTMSYPRYCARLFGNGSVIVATTGYSWQDAVYTALVRYNIYEGRQPTQEQLRALSRLSSAGGEKVSDKR